MIRAAKLLPSAAPSASPLEHMAVASLACSSVACMARKSPSAAWQRAVSAATGEATSRVTVADTRKKRKMIPGPCHLVMSHVWSVYQPMLKSDVEMATSSSARLWLQRSSSRPSLVGIVHAWLQ